MGLGLFCELYRMHSDTLHSVGRFCVLLTMHPCIFLQINPAWCTILLSIFISLPYMFRATMYPSSGGITISMPHWCLSLCMDGCLVCRLEPANQTATHTEWQIPVWHRYSNSSWWWAHSCPKHVEKRNKYTKKNSHQVGFICKIGRTFWTSDQPVADASTWPHKALSRDKTCLSRRDLNPQSQKARGRSPML